MASIRTTAGIRERKHINLPVKKGTFDAIYNVADRLNVSKSFVADAVFDRLCAGLTEEKVVEIVLSQMAARAKGA